MKIVLYAKIKRKQIPVLSVTVSQQNFNNAVVQKKVHNVESGT